MIEPMYLGAGKVGTSPRASAGAECTTKYQVMTIEGEGINCYVVITLINPLVGSNTHTATLQGDQCGSTLKVERGAYTGGSTAQVRQPLEHLLKQKAFGLHRVPS